MTDSTPDPFVAALEAELAEHGIAMPDMDEDMAFLCGLGRSLRRREQEVADIERWTAARIRTLKNQIASIWAWKQAEAMRCVARLLRGKKGKSIKVPGYQFGTRAAPAKIEWDHEYTTDIAEWASEHCPGAVTYPDPAPPAPRIDKAALIAWQAAHGRVPRHCTYRPAGDVPYASATKGTDDD